MAENEMETVSINNLMWLERSPHCHWAICIHRGINCSGNTEVVSCNTHNPPEQRHVESVVAKEGKAICEAYEGFVQMAQNMGKLGVSSDVIDAIAVQFMRSVGRLITSEAETEMYKEMRATDETV